MATMGKTILCRVYSAAEKNRFTVIVPIIGLILWIIAGISCTPQTASPIRPTIMLNADELVQEFDQWKADCVLISKKFELAGADIQKQTEQWNKVESVLMQIATGSVHSGSGLITLLAGSGIIGLLADNIRKNGVIGGLKRNKTVT